MYDALGSKIDTITETDMMVANAPCLQTLLEDVGHHLGSSISGNFLWDIEVGEVFSGPFDQSLGVKLTLAGFVDAEPS
jgi:hypothetical protein